MLCCIVMCCGCAVLCCAFLCCDMVKLCCGCAMLCCGCAVLYCGCAVLCYAMLQLWCGVWCGVVLHKARDVVQVWATGWGYTTVVIQINPILGEEKLFRTIFSLCLKSHHFVSSQSPIIPKNLGYQTLTILF